LLLLLEVVVGKKELLERVTFEVLLLCSRLLWC